MSDDRLYLIHILECIERVELYTHDGRDDFRNSTLIQDAVVRNLQILSESTQRLSDEIKASKSSIDWRGISGFRNILVHNYLGIDIDRVWEVVENDLPALKAAAEAMQSTIDDDDGEALPDQDDSSA